MISILITNTKGGCGKTTLATGLAAAFANSGLDTVLADCDRQKSSLGWVSRRPPEAAPVSGVNWTKNIVRLPAEVQRLVIDAPAALRRKQADDLVRLADIVILPVLPSVFDETTTRRFLGVLGKLKPLRKGKRVVAVVGNRVRARTLAAARLDGFLEETGYRAVARLRDSQLYPMTAASGLSIFDMRTKRAENFLQDWRPLLSFIDETAAILGE